MQDQRRMRSRISRMDGDKLTPQGIIMSDLTIALTVASPIPKSVQQKCAGVDFRALGLF